MPHLKSAIGIFSVVNGEDGDDSFFLVHHVKHPKSSDPVAPGGWRVSRQLLDVRAKEWFRSKLGIDITIELSPDQARVGYAQPFESSGEFGGFEYPKVRQSDLVPLSRLAGHVSSSRSERCSS